MEKIIYSTWTEKDGWKQATDGEVEAFQQAEQDGWLGFFPFESEGEED